MHFILLALSTLISLSVYSQDMEPLKEANQVTLSVTELKLLKQPRVLDAYMDLTTSGIFTVLGLMSIDQASYLDKKLRKTRRPLTLEEFMELEEQVTRDYPQIGGVRRYVALRSEFYNRSKFGLPKVRSVHVLRIGGVAGIVVGLIEGSLAGWQLYELQKYISNEDYQNSKAAY